MKKLLLILVALLASSLFAATTPDVAATINVGESFTLSVTADGTMPFLYQWWKDSSPIVGETSSTYTVAVAALKDAGSYAARVTNSLGGTDSNIIRLGVTTPPPPSVAPSNAKAAFEKNPNPKLR